MQQQAEIRRQMTEVRRRGLANAEVLAERVERLSDWREHVRAHPLPIALGVAALAYWLVPSRTRTGTASMLAKPDSRMPESRTGTVAPVIGGGSSGESSLAKKEARVASFAGVGGAAMGFVTSLVGNAVRSYVSEQVQTLITSRGNHDASQQRQAPLSRF